MPLEDCQRNVNVPSAKNKHNHAMITLDTIRPSRAAACTATLLNTPCVASQTLSQLTGAQIFLKFENLQFTASFKERGACNKLAQLTPTNGRAA